MEGVAEFTVRSLSIIIVRTSLSSIPLEYLTNTDQDILQSALFNIQSIQIKYHSEPQNAKMLYEQFLLDYHHFINKYDRYRYSKKIQIKSLLYISYSIIVYRNVYINCFIDNDPQREVSDEFRLIKSSDENDSFIHIYDMDRSIKNLKDTIKIELVSYLSYMKYNY